MPKKNWTPEERAAFGAKMKAAKQAKLNTQKTKPVAEEEKEQTTEQIVENPPVMESTQDLGDLLKQIAELKDNPLVMALFNGGSSQATSPVGAQVTSRGLVGSFEKYIIDPAHYPNPRERLASEPKLYRFAFNLNYELEFNVGISEYTTKDGINTKEPRFTLDLIRIVIDEETGEPTSGRYLVCRGVFHEDPQAAIVVARENGLQVDEHNEKAFLDEMRYIRMRDWLLEAFYPAKPDVKQKNLQEKVVGNRLVQFWEVSSEDATRVPFEKLAQRQ